MLGKVLSDTPFVSGVLRHAGFVSFDKSATTLLNEVVIKQVSSVITESITKIS